MPQKTNSDILDLAIIGAGIGGVAVAWRVAQSLPHFNYTVLEARDDVGGTWDLFRYPGIRSDSDMATFAFPFKPWRSHYVLGQGQDIQDYIRNVCAEAGILQRTQFGTRVESASWDSTTEVWTITAQRDGQPVTIRARRIHAATGYYSYDNPFFPDFPGQEQFTGDFFHAQLWPGNMDYQDKKVVVVGSGATAITLVPALARSGAAQVTMLQRTPTYVGCLPGKSATRPILEKILPPDRADQAHRLFNVVNDQFQYQTARRMPGFFKLALRGLQLKYLPDLQRLRETFTPPYNPWQQRLCRVPDGDFLTEMKLGRADVVTDTIETFTPTGIQTTSGTHLDADIVVAATGLRLEIMGQLTLTVDGTKIDYPQATVYRGLGLCGVPNFSFTFGYFNASWTLRADLLARYLVRQWTHMEAIGATTAIPNEPLNNTQQPLLDYESSYIKRDIHKFPKAADGVPFTARQNFLLESAEMLHDDVTREMTYTSAPLKAPADTPQFMQLHKLQLAGEPASSATAGQRPLVRAKVTTPEDFDPQTHRTVVCLHGIGRSLEDFDQQHHLLGEKYRVISLDHPGFGRSHGLAHPTFAALSDSAIDCLQQLGVQGPVDLVGSSMGGAIAMTVAAEHPQWVRSLGLVDSAGFGSEIFPLLRLVGLPVVGKYSMMINPYPLLRFLEGQIISQRRAITPAMMQTARENAANKDRPASYAALARVLTSWPGRRPQWQESLIAEVQKVRQNTHLPIYIAWGSNDHILPAKQIRGARQAFPTARIETFDGVGHLPALEAAELFARQYDAFLTETADESRHALHQVR